MTDHSSKQQQTPGHQDTRTPGHQDTRTPTLLQAASFPQGSVSPKSLSIGPYAQTPPWPLVGKVGRTKIKRQTIPSTMKTRQGPANIPFSTWGYRCSIVPHIIHNLRIPNSTSTNSIDAGLFVCIGL